MIGGPQSAVMAERAGAPAAQGADRGKAFIAVLACVLSRLVQQNDSVRGFLQDHPMESGPLLHSSTQTPPSPPPPQNNPAATGAPQRPASSKDVVTKFHALRPPTISIRDYLERCA